MMKPSRLLSFIGIIISASMQAQLPIINGWTQFRPSADSRIIFVSDSDGNDASATYYTAYDPAIGDNPFEPSGVVLPFKTIHAAKAHVRTGYADWILLKKGDTFFSQFFGLVNWSGKNAAETIVIGAYGSGVDRPRILTGAANLISFTGKAAYVSIVGIYAEPHTRSGYDEPVGVEILNAPFRGFLIEDCYLNQYFLQIVVQDYSGLNTYSHAGIAIRRSILTNGYKIGGGGGGLYFHGIDSILVEENLIDHNGWSTTIASANANGFSHNTYFHPSCGHLIFRNNIVSRASAVGIGARCGGLISNNLVLANPRGIFLGSFDPGQINYPTEFATGEISNNVVLDARVEPTYDPGNGITIERVKNTLVHRNIVAHFTNTSNYNIGIGINHAENISLKKNIVYNWGNNLHTGPAYAIALNIGSAHTNPIQIDSNDFQMKNTQGHCAAITGDLGNLHWSNNRYFNVIQPQNWFGNGNFTSWLSATKETNGLASEVHYSDPDRNITTYLSTLGISGDIEDFISERKQMHRKNWLTQFTAQTVNDYIRSGFDMDDFHDPVTTKNEVEFTYSFFPNPIVNGMLTIQGMGPTLYSLYQLDGQIIQQGFLKENIETIRIQTSKPGIYILKIGHKAIKILVE